MSCLRKATATSAGKAHDELTLEGPAELDEGDDVVDLAWCEELDLGYQRAVVRLAGPERSGEAWRLVQAGAALWTLG